MRYLMGDSVSIMYVHMLNMKILTRHYSRELELFTDSMNSDRTYLKLQNVSISSVSIHPLKSVHSLTWLERCLDF